MFPFEFNRCTRSVTPKGSSELHNSSMTRITIRAAGASYFGLLIFFTVMFYTHETIYYLYNIRHAPSSLNPKKIEPEKKIFSD
jgi:hypothetical protein